MFIDTRTVSDSRVTLIVSFVGDYVSSFPSFIGLVSASYPIVSGLNIFALISFSKWEICCAYWLAQRVVQV